MRTIPNELDRFVSTTETQLEQNRNTSRTQYMSILKDTLKKLEAIAERGKGA